MWQNFNVSDMLPDINALLPDVSVLSESLSVIPEMINQTFSSIPENITVVATSISEGFSQIPTAATSAFTSISTFANQSFTAIQSEWGQLPAFFDGLWSGAGAAASAAGSAIASGINSAIGIIQSAWEGLSGWLSAKISALSSMASSAASSIMSFSIGSNATGTASWRGGFTEVNEQGGEIIDLPRGTRIYPHATTMKMLRRDIEDGKLDDFIGHNATGTMSWHGGLTEVNEQGGEIIDLPGGKRLYPQSTVMELVNRLTAFSPNYSSTAFSQDEVSAFSQVEDISNRIVTDFASSSSSTRTGNNGVTVSGNTFNIRNENDINEIAFRLFELMTDHNANYAGA